MTTDDRFDDTLRELARSYHEPPPTPRDRMWERVAAARAQRPVQTRHPLRRTPWWMGLAAALLLGVVLGRSVLAPAIEQPDVDPAAPSLIAEAGQPPGAEPPVQASGEQSSLAEDAEPRASTPLSGGRPAPQLRPAPTPATEAPVRTVPADVSELYRFVAYETLGQAEALLTVYRAEENREARQRVAAWARDILTSTRLLIGSPAADDPQLATLLRDLELVLAQIAALDRVTDGESDGDEQEMIEDAIRQRDVMPRLRTTIPAGVSSAGASS